MRHFLEMQKKAVELLFAVLPLVIKGHSAQKQHCASQSLAYRVGLTSGKVHSTLSSKYNVNTNVVAHLILMKFS